MPSRGSLGLLLAAIGLSATPLVGQVVRLPAVVAQDESYPGRLVSHPDSAAELLQAPGERDLSEESDLARDARPGVFQKLIFESTWLAPGGRDDLGISTLESKVAFAVPFPVRESPLIILPGFAVHYLDGPATRDLPPQLYDAYTQFRWLSRPVPQVWLDLSVTPGVYSDFQHSNDDAFRLTGHAAAMWTVNPELKVVLGAAYVDRWTVDVLPICGVIWTPHDDVKYELMFPTPQIARRIYWSGAYTDEVQDWIYIAGELGGGTWTFLEANGLDDRIDYTDYRVFLGVERKVIGGLDAHVEIGYVFGRKVRFSSGTPELRP
ncbi:MAG: hypothetical protein A2V70_16085, partial [Planctomycetes bacterium RBG_13_63_9]